MTGVTFPACMRSRMMVRSSLFRLVISMTNFWLTNRDSTSPLIARLKRIRSLGAPTVTHLPLALETRLQAESEWFATQSKIRS
jgi:hypothetical protein